VQAGSSAVQAGMPRQCSRCVRSPEQQGSNSVHAQQATCGLALDLAQQISLCSTAAALSMAKNDAATRCILRLGQLRPSAYDYMGMLTASSFITSLENVISLDSDYPGCGENAARSSTHGEIDPERSICHWSECHSSVRPASRCAHSACSKTEL
jgi:hypothetical protein